MILLFKCDPESEFFEMKFFAEKSQKRKLFHDERSPRNKKRIMVESEI